jgi:mono/diheme cytochrome c family protein
MKDSVMFVLIAIVLVVMSLVMGAEQGPKADPTTTTYVPRPEWYFFFLFELLKVIKSPELVPVATVGIPTICMVLLLLLPFYDRGPERIPWKRPIASITGVMVIIAMAYLTYLGAASGSPSEIELETKPQYEQGKQIVAQSGCLACHAIGENGSHGGLGPDLTEIGSMVPRLAIKRSVAVGPGIMPAYEGLGEKKLNQVADYLASLD